MTALPVLDAVDQRVVGSLMEKQVTVPASYPLTLNSLRIACNQSTSRDPVVSYDEPTVEDTARSLKSRGLIRVVREGSRVRKFHQTLDEVLRLDQEEHALLTVLLLRGAQSAGELRTRAERLHPFPDRSAAEACLTRLAGRDQPLVQELAKRPGWQDPRWIHLLGPVEIPGGPVETAEHAAVDRDSPLGEGASVRDAAVRAHFDAAAATTSRWDPTPFESWVLDRVVGFADGRPAVDAACGAGHVAGELAARGVAVSGSDISPAMVAKAREAYPGVVFEVRDLRRLMRPTAADGWGVTLAFGVLDLFGESELEGVLSALVRPLSPMGYAVVTCTVGPDVVPGDGPVRVHHDPGVVLAAARRVGLTDLEWYRHGQEGAEAETLWLFARHR